MPRLLKKLWVNSPLSQVSDEVLRSAEVGLVVYFENVLPITNRMARSATWAGIFYIYEALLLPVA